MARFRDQRGSVAPLLAVVVLAVGGLGLGLARLGAEASIASRAQTAADAAALAGAAEGREAAASLARANGAELSSYSGTGSAVVVEVRLGDVEARAKAVAVGGAVSPGRAGQVAGLIPAMRVAIDRAAAILGYPVPITSGWRSPAKQQALWNRRATNPFPVARPGTSMHERGMAIDVPRRVIPALVAVGPRVGLCQPLPRTDPVHFELCRGR